MVTDQARSASKPDKFYTTKDRAQEPPGKQRERQIFVTQKKKFEDDPPAFVPRLGLKKSGK